MKAARWLLALFLICTFGSSEAGLRLHGSAGAAFSPFVAQAQIGGGGWNTGVDIANDGHRLLRTDTYGAFIFNSSTGLWEQLVTQARMPAANFGYFPTTGTSQVLQGGGGVYEIAHAPQNSNIIYMVFNGATTSNLFVSTNKGDSFTNTGWNPTHYSDPNGHFRQNGRKMAVDPQNIDHVYIGSDADGMFETTNGTNAGGATFSSVTAVPTANSASYSIAFDPSSGLCSGKTCIAYAFAGGGTNMYKTTDGGSTWAATVAGGPSSMDHMIVAPTGGVVWATDSTNGQDGAGGNLWKFVPGAPDVWTKVTGAGTNCHSVAIDPNTTSHIFCIGAGGDTVANAASGAGAWTTTGKTLSSADVPWLANTGGILFMSVGDVVFDKAVSGLALMGMGLGTFTSTIPTSGTVAWASLTAGQEQLVATDGIAPNGLLLAGNEDRSTFLLTNPAAYPTTQNNTYNSVLALAVSYAVDYAAGNTNFMAALVSTSFGNAGVNSGNSSDGGSTWKPFNSYYQTVHGTDLTGCTGSNPIIITNLATTTGLTTWSAGAGSIVRVLNNGNINKFYPATVLSGTSISLQNSSCADTNFNTSASATYQIIVETQPLDDRNGFWNISSVVSDAGLIQVVVGDAGQDIQDGNLVCISSVGGVTAANGCWVAVNSNGSTSTFDLFGSIFAGSYTNNTGNATVQIPNGGSIAVSTSSNIIIAPSNSDHPFCTTDGGQTWTQLVFPSSPINSKITAASWSGGTLTFTTAGATNIAVGDTFVVHGMTPLTYNKYNAAPYTAIAGTSGTTVKATVADPGAATILGTLAPLDTGWNQNFFNFSHIMVADRVTANTFYGYSYKAGVYQIVNCGTPTIASGTALTGGTPHTATANLFPSSTFVTQLKSVPGYAGHLFFTSGSNGSGLRPAARSLYRSTNGGQDWFAIANVSEPFRIDCSGAIAPGSDYPTCYMVGWVSNVYGVWRTTATAAQWASGAGTGSSVVWTKVSDYPLGSMDNPQAIVADGVTWNKWYVGFSGSGWARGQQN